uniref:Secreted protein n=1 Tax=Steinernema glaseri TaxID=37863 RepID=A0A1I7YG70_9BILA
MLVLLPRLRPPTACFLPNAAKERRFRRVDESTCVKLSSIVVASFRCLDAPSWSFGGVHSSGYTLRMHFRSPLTAGAFATRIAAW